MAHLLSWPGTYFFYPIGNTSATCLTRDISPDEPAHILLLGCGDPRNVLYTIHSEPQSQTRQLDFTCCDFDAAILARNVLLFTMLLDEKPIKTTTWNIFFHMYLDKASHSVLVQQCKKLISYSESSQKWNDSPYGSCLRMCTDYTLRELRRHWTLYAEMQDLPRSRLETIRKAFTDSSKITLEKFKHNLSPARSAGPAFILAPLVALEHFKHYWKIGVAFTDDQKLISASTVLNPTFVYSLAGEGCAVHYGTDPTIPFHHAALFGNAKKTPSITDLVKSSKASFNDWCSSFKSLSGRCVLRFFLGEVTAVCAALGAFADTGSLDTGIPAMRWKMPLIQLNGAEYISGSAPHAFNVIDTSNLEDHLGLLNIVIATVPLLSRSSPSSTLYTESLVLSAQEDTTKHFNERLYANIAVASLLFGICPVEYLSGFSSRCNTTEIAMHMILGSSSDSKATQFHRVTTWKFTTSGDILLKSAQNAPILNDLTQLGSLLYDMYHTMFEQEDSTTFLRLNQSNFLKAIQFSNIVHYSRETFVLMLKLIRKNLQIPAQCWLEVMDHFIALRDADRSMPMDSVNYNDLCAHLYRHSIYTVPFYNLPSTRSGIFSAWPSTPPIVRVFLTVPRSALSALEELPSEQIGTPPLQCTVKGQWSYNIFCCIHTAFGRVISTGTSSRPSVLFEEDEKGWKGGPSSSLVVSFVMSSGLLTDIEPQENISVRLGIRSTPGTVMLMSKLGLDLVIFSAKLMNKDHVIVIPEQPLPQPSTATAAPSHNETTSPLQLASEIGTLNPVVVELDEQCKLLTLFTCRVAVENDKVRLAFEAAGEMPQIAQVSPCVMRLTISGYKQDIPYPFPVVGSNNKLRLARKSLWVEVVVPVSGPLKPDGMKLTPFPVIRHENSHSPVPWNIHRINLSNLPTLNLRSGNKDLSLWLNPHIGSMMSARERSLKENQQVDTLMYVKDTLHSIFVHAAGLQNSGPPRNLFTLCDVATKNCDAIFFISDIKYDLSSHTMICDGYVLPLTSDITPRLHTLLSKTAGMVNIRVDKGEMQAWKQLLPAFVERCRMSWTHQPNCEYNSQGKIPLTEEMGRDPLCSCGRGKDTEGMKRVALWREYAPYVTRVALSPLFAVSYLDPIGLNPSKYKCSVCHGAGKPNLRKCSACKEVWYCSPECQKKDWKAHKPRCKPQ